MRTIKLPYQSDNKNLILDLQKSQSVLIGKTFQFLKSEPTQIKITNYLNFITTDLDSWFKQSAVYEANGMLKADQALYELRLSEWKELKLEKKYKKKKPTLYRLFGGKKNLIDYKTNKISKQQFQSNRVMPLVSIGESSKKGNRKFEIDYINNKIIFKPNRKTKINLFLPKLRNNYQRDIEQLCYLSQNKQIPLTFKLDQEFVYISFEDLPKLKINGSNILAIDLNPNHIGISIQSQEQKILFTRYYNISELTDSNKQRYELSVIAKQIINLCHRFSVTTLVLEKLEIKVKNHNKGKVFNRNVNNKWNRKDFEHYLQKRCNLYGIILKKIRANYSSFIGNIINHSYVDPVASSIELGRRSIVGQSFYPELPEITHLSNQLAETRMGVTSWKQWYDRLKNQKLRYRVSFDKTKVFKTFLSHHSLIKYDSGIISTCINKLI